MKIDVLTIFPNMVNGPLNESIVGKAIESDQLQINVTDFRDYSTNKHGNVDDSPYGGGAGMLLTPQPIFDAMEHVKTNNGGKLGRVILVDPAGKQFDQHMAEYFAKEEQLTFICGHYEGYDERIKTLVTDEVSLGDFVITGGELAALTMIDATVRLLPGILGNSESAPGDSYSSGLLEYPQYTRPADFRGMKVPDILLSGNHQKIDQWRRQEALKKTLIRRPDLLEEFDLTAEDRKMLDEIKINLHHKHGLQ
ncbi:tRNA (guanosine(37)-N1)-methyltransferase TrmD [Pediococcus argentinicus]|uniref:tRNA (guanine-N(1)-)-methyltransferase n=1 Tax=Pediococcus argentinicus TaxID=480391 RepID=A0A0R2NH53_9LACO|nr:tRNA (guanosine(37)-N1)-methyltransferase TrmD [Pediococcus argentinicus]KRO25153.1 trmD protein [Pediococcus argentinicus]NKZ22411.1 tRNA (guanosine(37)-N1)-methyltransferase TrmD [Pediococcus argentinicus]GEP19511.1 tRNA (guanine-N(1)-)-methyltransferase [Pediococcus argentinicus]